VSRDGDSRVAHVRWALLFGNFVIGCGIMVVPGTLIDLARSLQISIALGGQLFALGAATVCFGAPLLAGWVAGFDRRRLLAASLAAYGAGHALCAVAPSYAALAPIRAATMLGAAVFTPQAAAAIGFMSAPEHRGRSIAFIFLGWSVASVFGLPLSAWLADTFGWRFAFAAVAAISVLAAIWVFAVMPDDVRPAALSLAAWKQAFTSPLLMVIVAVTFLTGAGQFTVFAYIAPYFRNVLHASTLETSLLLVSFGVFGVIGNVVLTRVIDRVGEHVAATTTVCLIAVTFVSLPFVGGVIAAGFALAPWALGIFSGQSAQQARLSAVAPALAPALLALNTSAIYLGQATGASSGGWLIARLGYGALSEAGLVWLVAAIAFSLWAMHAARKRPS
jgi:predicted MFS family arabinose efflux permease